jgi:uncharacterized protein (DUF2164 family)
MVIRPALPEDFSRIHAVINAAAVAYRGIIPADRWHEPYMPERELHDEIAQGVTFFTAGDAGTSRSLQRFAETELDWELSELQARHLLGFILREIAPTAYNAGVADAEAFMRDRVADLEGSCHEPEFAYWPKGASVRRKR